MVNPSALVTNGALVTSSNPLPVSVVGAGATGTDRTLNPRDFVANGDLVSATNPLPVTFVVTATQSWAAAVVTNGGTVSDARAAIVNDFILAERASGAWDLTDDYWGLWAENAAQSLTSLKQLRLATVVSAPVFTADRGYTFTAAGVEYINSGFVPSTHAVALTGTNMRVAMYERTAVATAYGIGGGVASNTTTIALNVGGATVNSLMLAALTSATFTGTTALGFSAASRAGGGTTVTSYRNGVAGPTATAVTPLSALPTLAAFIGLRNLNGAPTNAANHSMGFACIGAPLSAAQELAQFNNVRAWATAVGAQV